MRWIGSVLAGVALLTVGPTKAASPCAGEERGRDARLQALPPHGDLVFETGLAATIPGLFRADGIEAARAREGLLAQWRGMTFTLHALPREDRWGREVAVVMLGGVDAAEALLRAGAALFQPDRAPQACAGVWRAAEAVARRQKQGVWADADAPLRDAANPGKDATGRFLLMAGRITLVGERPRRVYLNFGPPGSGAATVSMPTRIWRDLAGQGVNARSLKGRRVLVRGIPDEINGRIMLDLTNAAAIELDP